MKWGRGGGLIAVTAGSMSQSSAPFVQEPLQTPPLCKNPYKHQPSVSLLQFQVMSLKFKL